MKTERRAVIDIGTNSVKLLVADWDGETVVPLLEGSEQTRLGKGFYEDHLLQAESIEGTARAVARFSGKSQQQFHCTPLVIATSAARDARNPGDLLDAVAAQSGLTPRIISGEQEAEWVYQGISSTPGLDGKPLLILDVGGGSTEIIAGEAHHYHLKESFPLGSVRLQEIQRPGDPPSLQDLAHCRDWLNEFFKETIHPSLGPPFRDNTPAYYELVGSGGTASILARMELKMSGFDRDRIEGLVLTHRQVLDSMMTLWSVPLAERRKITGVPANRADILPMGVAIYEAAMTHFGRETLHVSTRGLRFGAIMHPGG